MDRAAVKTVFNNVVVTTFHNLSSKKRKNNCMTVKDLIKILSRLDQNLCVVTNVDKYNTHKLVNYVRVGFYDSVSGSFIEQDDSDLLKPEAVSICN